MCSIIILLFNTISILLKGTKTEKKTPYSQKLNISDPHFFSIHLIPLTFPEDHSSISFAFHCPT